MKFHSFFAALLLCFSVCLHSLKAADLPPGFAELLVAQDLDPTAMALSPDGRIFITEKNGRVLIVENGQLLPDPFLVLEVDNYNERGLSGIAFHPDFEENGYVYLYYTVKDANHNRVSRFVASGNYSSLSTEDIILDLDPLNGTIHNAGAMAFGADDKLYITTGDGANGDTPQSFSSLLGKILRINDDGSIPEDNPFFNELTDVYRSIYALGLRNPFSLDIQPGTGRIFVSEVGAGSWEEVNEILPGRNYGWPLIEGPISGQTPPENYMDPVFRYTRTHGCAVVGAAFYNPDVLMFPEPYHGKFFFADYCNGHIRFIDPASPGTATFFATNINRPLSIIVAPDGTMYYLARAGLGGGSEEDNTATTNGTLWRVFYTGSGAPFVSVNPESILVSVGEEARFATAASGAEPLTFQWQQNGVDIPGANQSEFIFPNAMLTDDGTLFRCIVSNANGHDTTLAATLFVTASQRPEVTIVSPTEGTTYVAGELLQFSGFAIDNEQGMLEPDALRWKIDFHHDTHTHPGLIPTDGIAEGSFFIPQIGETSDNVWYRVYFSATDATGLTKTVSRDVFPQKTQFHVTSEPEGLPIYVESNYTLTPVTTNSVVGIARRIEAIGSIQRSDSLLLFRQWSDGVTDLSRVFPAEADTITYTAIYEAIPLGAGTGVTGYYYDSPDWDPTFYEPYKFDWIDTTINFDWAEGSPAPSQLGNDHWLVRWEGFLEPLFTDVYDFSVIADDGLRLWVDSQLIIDAWIPQPPTEWTGSIELQAKQLYPLRLEFFEEGGGALCRLLWSSSKLAKDIVPRRQLYIKDITAVGPVADTRIRLFPNPVSSILTLDLPDAFEGDVLYEIYDVLGQRIRSKTEYLTPDGIQIDVSDFVEGLYWIKCRMAAVDFRAFAFVKQ